MTTRTLPLEIYRFREALLGLGGVAAIDRDGKILAVNEIFIGLFGYNEDEIVGQQVSALVIPTDVPRFREQIWEPLTKGGTWVGEFPCLFRDGTKMIVRISICHKDEGGQVAGYLALFQRVVYRRADLLSEIFYRYRDALNSQAAMAIVACDGKILGVNECFTDLYGYSADDVVGRNVSLLRSGETPAECYHNLWSTVKAGRVWEGELKNRCKEGDTVWVRSRITPSSDHYVHGTHVDAYLVMYHNIQHEIEVRDMRVQRAVDASRQEMVTGVLHNFANLMSGVHTSSTRAYEILQDALTAVEKVRQRCQELEAALRASLNDPEKTQESLDALGNFQSRAFDILDQSIRSGRDEAEIASLSATEAKDVLVWFREQHSDVQNVRDSTPSSLTDMAQRWVHVFAPQYERHGIAFTLSDMPEVSVVWPVQTVSQIVFNLLKNSKEAVVDEMRLGQMSSGRIDLSFERGDGDTILVRVRDTGGGFKINPEDLFKYKKTTKPYGTGVGLHNAQIMAISIGGRITARNIEFDEHQGARMTLRLPRVVMGSFSESIEGSSNGARV